MSGYDQPMATSGDQSEYIVSPNPESPSTFKKSSIFGKLKDKTRKAGSKIKSKVVKKKNPDGTDAAAADGDEHEEYGDEDATTSDDSPIASPGTSTDLGSTFPSEPSRFASDSAAAPPEESVPVRDMSALSLDEPAALRSGTHPSVADKAFDAPEGAVDDGAGATAGAVGIDDSVLPKEPESEEQVFEPAEATGAAPDVDSHPSVTDKAFDASEGIDEAVPKETESEKVADASEPTQDIGAQITEPEVADSGYDAAPDANDAVADNGSEVAEHTDDVVPSSIAVEHKAIESEEATEPEAMDSEVATDQSPNALETEEAPDQPTDVQDAVESKAEDVNNATDDSTTYTERAHNAAVDAKDTVSDSLGVDQAKETTGIGEEQPSDEPSTVDQAKETTQSALDTTHDQAAQAQQSVADTATPKPEDKALSEQVTETLAAAPAQVHDTAASVVESAKSPTTTTPGTITDAPAAHSSEPASPGILGKITGLFGFGAKHPEDHSHDGHAAH